MQIEIQMSPMNAQSQLSHTEGYRPGFSSPTPVIEVHLIVGVFSVLLSDLYFSKDFEDTVTVIWYYINETKN